MKTPLKSYGFWLKIIGAALLITFAVWMLLDQSMAIFIVLLFTGLVAGIFAIIRVIPLIRTLTSRMAKMTCLGEIVLHLVVAGLLIFGAISIQGDKDSIFARFMSENYRFIIASFFFIRIVAYFMCTVLFEEKTDKVKFWVHIGLILVCCILCALSNLKSTILATIIAVIALFVALGLIVDAGVSYNRYRKQNRKPKEIIEEKNVEDSVELPPLEDIEDIIIPTIDDNYKDPPFVN